MAKHILQPDKLSKITRMLNAGHEHSTYGIVNPPVYHASTIQFPSVASLSDHSQPYSYGRRGTPTSLAAESAVSTLEGGDKAKICPSGLAAISTALLAFLKPGDHLLMVDSVYGPARYFCQTILKNFQIETSYYAPQATGAEITQLMRPNTKVVYCESPGSQTMEVQDVPAIAAAAHAKGAVVMIDNTWSGGLYFDAFAHGCDVSLQAATKYIIGHSDAMLGSVTCSHKVWPQFQEFYESMGQFAGPDDMYLAFRSMKTLPVRLAQHMKNALVMAEWLAARPEVERVLYPALPSDPGHALWRRDFTGASGLFSFILKPVSAQAVAALVDGLELFGLGYSWGGYESLVMPFKPERSATEWRAKGPAIRLHIGLEAPDDLKADLAAGFERLQKTA